MPARSASSQLEELVLDHTGITGVGLKWLEAFSSLKNVSLMDVQITSKELEPPAKSIPNLEKVDLAGSNVDDRGVALLSKRQSAAFNE